jgi:hypothetical protein
MDKDKLPETYDIALIANVHMLVDIAALTASTKKSSIDTELNNNHNVLVRKHMI